MLLTGSVTFEDVDLAGVLVGIAAAICWAAGSIYQRNAVRPERFSSASAIALSYLIVVGSWIGFTSYLWLLRNARTSLVATYAYVTPVGAVVLGALVLDERLTARTVLAGVVMLVGVGLIVTARPGRAPSEPGEQPRPQIEAEL